ncbi:hypothetical protein, conserved [Babesia ovata]|uniref:6-Cys domain-containing protein n=1 Tax=Babesia ovata TaxID=189622 RepID=A0A2H6KBE2_9APIC|nr:uncharacterized protein BOVATA_017970 [Babesia ovata]GBE60304.1 hypothetical protein, conserved [Babesia ovata]
MDVGLLGSGTVICPRRSNDTEYVWHPQPFLDASGYLNAYVGDNGKFRSVPVSDLIVTESTRALFWVESKELQTNLHINISDDDIYAITENRLIFICGPRDLVLSDTLQRHLDLINGFRLTEEIPWTPSTHLTQEIAKIGKGLGVVFLNRRGTFLPLQGCGSRPSPLFAMDNEVTVDPVTGTRSCVANPMSKSRIGFICEGRIEPHDCMKYLLDNNDTIVTVPQPHSYRNLYNKKPWVVAQYFDDLALPHFNGYCRCMDTETGQVKARIEIRVKTDHVCDIAKMIDGNRQQPIRVPWCSVVLHPGSTLTIKLPTEHIRPVYTDEDMEMDIYSDSDKNFAADITTLPFPQLQSVYEYETDLLPNDLTTLRQLKKYYDLESYDEIFYKEAMAGDALELDRSQIAQGEIKLKYHVDKPLTSLGGHNSFFFHCTLKSRNQYIPDMIRAIINVSFAFTHRYRIVGCDQGPQSLFDKYIGGEYCSVKSMGNGIGDSYECLYDNMWDRSQVGIRCRPNEELLPDNCEHTGYDLYYNRIMPFPMYVRNVTPYPVRGFQVLEMDFKNTRLIYACMCVDQSGYEKSRLVLEYNKEDFYSFNVRRAYPSHPLHPHMLLPWSEVGLLSGGLTSPKSLVLNNISQRSVILHVGTTVFMRCGLDQKPHHDANNERITTTWLPKRPEVLYYTVNDTPHGTELIRRTYNESFATTTGGFSVTYDEPSGEYQGLTIKSRRGAVLVSKDPHHKKYVPMTFVCGKTPEPSDLSIITGDISKSHQYAPYIPHGIGSLSRYTWNIIHVQLETTDPYMQGCGVTYASDELFKPETPQLYDSNGKPQFGCKIDLHMAKEAAFYCQAPYLLDPPNCFSQVYVDGTLNHVRAISKSLAHSRSSYFAILRFHSSLVALGETMRQTPPLECRCVTVKGVVLSTIQIENYYSK